MLEVLFWLAAISFASAVGLMVKVYQLAKEVKILRKHCECQQQTIKVLTQYKKIEVKFAETILDAEVIE